MTRRRTDAEIAKRLGRETGFDLVRIASAEPLVEEGERFAAWIDAGRHGEMGWITRERAARASVPSTTLPGARSVICVGLSYWTGRRPPPGAGRGMIARYAWGADYHTVVGDMLEAYSAGLEGAFGGRHRGYVDTGPLMDKALAARSGLGWYGKNTNILSTSLGSYVLLGEIVTTLDLEPDTPLEADCGACRLCQVACPTGALGPDYSIDSRKCISYLTIEHRGPIDRALRPLIGAWVFGCDICQDVCPPTVEPHLRGVADRRAWLATVRQTVHDSNAVPTTNPAAPSHEIPAGPQASVGRARAQPSGPPPGIRGAPAPRSSTSATAYVSTGTGTGPLFPHGTRPDVDLIWLLQLTHGQYLEAFRGTAVKRAKRWMLRRNAAVALGNVGDESCVEALARAMRDDEHPVVRGHAAWAFGHLAGRRITTDARRYLFAALPLESDPAVREEIEAALHASHAPPHGTSVAM